MSSYYIYARKSSDNEDRQVLSIEAQLHELREFARREGLNITREFTESKTAKEPGRPLFNEMVSEIESGRADGIIAWNPDRLARNSVDGGKIIYLVDKGIIRSLKFPTFWFEDSPQGKFNLSIAFGQSKYMVDNLSENVKRGIRQKLRRGEFPGPAPLGYINDLRNKTIEPHPVHFDEVRSLFEKFSLGKHSLSEIRDEMFSYGMMTKSGGKLKLDTVKRMLRNPFYYGMFLFKGELHEGSHEPMITKATFDKIQKVLELKYWERYKPNQGFVFRGIAQCEECGSPLTSEEQRGKNSVHRYYRCTKRRGPCDQKYIREADLVSQITDTVSSLSLNDDWSEKILEQFEEWRRDERKSSDKRALELEDEIREIKSKISKVLDLHLEGEIEVEDYKSKKETLLKAKRDIEEKIQDIRHLDLDWFEKAKTLVESSAGAKNLISKKNYSGMRDFLKNTGSKSTIHDKKLSFSFPEPWGFFIEQPELCLVNSSQSFAFEESKSIAGGVGIRETPRSGQLIGGAECAWEPKWQAWGHLARAVALG